MANILPTSEMEKHLINDFSSSPSEKQGTQQNALVDFPQCPLMEKFFRPAYKESGALA